MLSHDQAADIFSRIKKYSTADEVEGLFYGGRSALTRFANNTIHQNVAEENYGVSVRTVFGGRTARATTNRFDDQSLKDVVKASEDLARVQEPDADLRPMADAGEGARPTQAVPSRHFAETAAVTPELRADGVGKIVAIAQRHKLTTAGIFSSSESVEGIFNSRGLSNWHTQTSAEISITMLALDSSGWQKSNSPNVTNLNPQALAEIAAKKATESENPREIAAGKYTVILEPSAVLDMTGFMFFDFGGLAILDPFSTIELATIFSARTFPFGMMWLILCSQVRHSMARACDGKKSNSSKTASSNGWSMRAPAQRKCGSQNTRIKSVRSNPLATDFPSPTKWARAR
jgi:PmbA protein